jgi:hypothetical protein
VSCRWRGLVRTLAVMATEATRRARPSLSALLAILLALIAGLSAPPLVIEQAGPTAAATSVSAEAAPHGDAPAQAENPELPAPVDAVRRTSGVLGRERAWRTSPTLAVCAARAPPVASA